MLLPACAVSPLLLAWKKPFSFAFFRGYARIVCHVALENKPCRRARRTWLCHAGGMGTARGDLARLAAQRERLAGKVRGHPVDLRRDDPQNFRRRKHPPHHPAK